MARGQAIFSAIDGANIPAAMLADGVYLDLHGAMVAKHYDDGEGEVLRRVRALDRTYPHVDMADTGARAFVFMHQRLMGVSRPSVAVRRIAYSLPTCWQSTMIMPAKGLYERLEILEAAPGVLSMSVCMGSLPLIFLIAVRSCGPMQIPNQRLMRRLSHGPGPSACLLIGGVRVVLAAYKAQIADQAMFRYVGIEPTEQNVLVLKSSAHFREDFTPIAADILICAAPGPMPMDLPWSNLRDNIRMYPHGPTFEEFKSGINVAEAV